MLRGLVLRGSGRMLGSLQARSASGSTHVDSPYEEAMRKAGRGTQVVKDLSEMPGPTSSKEFLSFVQRSQLIADRPQKEAFYELLFSEYGDLVRCDAGSKPTIQLGTAEAIQEAVENSKELPQGSYYYRCYQKKHNRPSALMGENRARFQEPLAKFFGNPTAGIKLVEPMRKISQHFLSFLEPQIDPYTKVPANLSLL
jgi:hypothetical protein